MGSSKSKQPDPEYTACGYFWLKRPRAYFKNARWDEDDAFFEERARNQLQQWRRTFGGDWDLGKMTEHANKIKNAAAKLKFYQRIGMLDPEYWVPHEFGDSHWYIVQHACTLDFARWPRLAFMEQTLQGLDFAYNCRRVHDLATQGFIPELEQKEELMRRLPRATAEELEQWVAIGEQKRRGDEAPPEEGQLVAPSTSSGGGSRD